MVATIPRTFNRTILTGVTSYRKGFFGGLIMTVEIKEQEAFARVIDLESKPPPPTYTDEQKAQYRAQEDARVEAYWVTTRVYYRDAREDDMRSLAISKQRGAKYAIQQDDAET